MWLDLVTYDEKDLPYLLKASNGDADILLYGILSQNFYVSIIVFLGDAQHVKSNIFTDERVLTSVWQYFHRWASI